MEEFRSEKTVKGGKVSDFFFFFLYNNWLQLHSSLRIANQLSATRPSQRLQQQSYSNDAHTPKTRTYFATDGVCTCVWGRG